MRGGRRLWFWMGLLILAAATAGSVAFLFHDPTRDSPSALVSTLVTVATAAITAAAWLWRQRRPSPRLPLEHAADELAEQLRQQWARAAAERRLITPPPIPVQWQWSSRQVTGPITEAVEGPFAPLPDEMAEVTAEQLRCGTLRDLLAVYGGLGSGRLVILGEPGAGKSGAGIWLLRDALAHRAALTAEDRVRVPVPVLVSPQGWDPFAEPFAEWLATRLARDYPLLRAPEYGEDAAMRLIKGERLAVILDGLDEIPEALRSEALRALDRQATFRLVVLSRSKELVAAVRGGGHLRGAAALELLPIGARQAAEYLASDQIHPPPAPWRHVIDHLREHPEGVLAQALNTPLTLTLVRDTYGPGERVDELIDVEGHRFGSREAIEDHLLDRVLTAAYTQHPGRPAPPYTVDQARRWLGHLARRMKVERTHDLAWWQIPHWVPAWPRAFATVVVISVVSAFLVGSLAALAAPTQLLGTFQDRPLPELAAVAGKILGFGFMFGFGLLLMSPPEGASPQQPDRLRYNRTDILVILLLGLGVGIGFGLERGFGLGLGSGLERGLAGGLVASFVVGLGFVLGEGPPQQLGGLRWSRTDTRANLHTGLVIVLVAGLVTGLVYGLLQGPRFGLVYGFIVGIGYLLAIVIGGQRSPQQNQLGRRRIDTPTTLLIGLVIATVTTGGYGIIYVLIVILAGRLPLQRNWLRWSRITSPTTLLAGLIAGLVFGLGYGLVYALTTGLLYGLGLEHGLRPGLALGLVFGLTVGLLLGLRQPPTEATSPLDPWSLWRRERQFGLVIGLVIGLVTGFTGGLANGLVAGLVAGLVTGLTGGLVYALGAGLVSSATWPTVLANAQLQRRGEAPARLLRFLDDARERQILRTVGPVYQFRDARLQDRLAATCKTAPAEASDTHINYPSLSS